MAKTSHVFCVPFPSAGHAVNMMNLAWMLASQSMPVHVLVPSREMGERWLKACGQPENLSLSIEALANGKYESWRGTSAMSYFNFVKSDEFNESVDQRVQEVSKDYPSDRSTAIVYNPLMTGMISIGEKHDMKKYVLSPVPFYMLRLGQACLDNDPLDKKLEFLGIGGSDQPLEINPGDCVDVVGPMAAMSRPGFISADGIIETNTNDGLEGNHGQEHLPTHFKLPHVYSVGPILPQWYERAFDNLEEQAERRKLVGDDEVLRFMDTQNDKSVVYVGMGSHVELEVEQAKLVVDNLRKNNTPWVLLFRQGTEQAREALGGNTITDGIVTPWAPQLDIILHPALKCVVSHGGFGTMIEGVFAGQPFITSPVMSDQFLDTKVLQHLGIGLGGIAENKHMSIANRPKATPFFPEDGGAHIGTLLEKVFGSAEGDKLLADAREASRRLRARLVGERQANGRRALENLKQEISSLL